MEEMQKMEETQKNEGQLNEGVIVVSSAQEIGGEEAIIDDEEGLIKEEGLIEEEGIMSEDIKIPKERVAVLVGKGGSVKSEIQKKTKCNLDIDSESGHVLIEGTDAILLFDCKNIVLAVGRGFNPKIALKLLKEEFSLEVIRLRDIVGGNQKQLERLRSRVIGRAGKVRFEIERLTDCDIAVYGKTVSIIGDSIKVALCHRAIEMLLGGAMHKTVYTFLEKKNREDQVDKKEVF